MLFKSFKNYLTVDFIDSCLTAVFLLFFALNSTAFSETCQILNTDNKRRKEIHFNDGRTIEVIGHNHGETAQVAYLHFNTTKNTYSDNSVYLQQIYDDLKPLKEATQHAEEDLKYLREKAPTKTIQFIAIENGAINFSFFKKNSMQFLDEIKQQHASRKLPESQITEKLFENAFLTFTGAARYLKISDPQLMADIDIIGADDDNLVPKNLSALTSAYLDLIQLKELYPENSKLSYVLSNMQKNPTYLFDQEFKDIKATLYSTVPKQHHKLLKQFFNSVADMTRIQKQRDQNMVQNIINENSSGILIVGLAHLKPITEILKQRCEQNNLQSTTKTKLRF